MKRKVKVGNLKTGKNNSITDVLGVKVGHVTYHDDVHHTGVTAIVPKENIFQEKVLASCYTFNGFGKSIGFMQVEELGTLETPIILTNTLAVGRAADGLIHYMLDKNPDICVKTGSVNPLVMECNDAVVNNIRDIIITKEDVYKAIDSASINFKQGSNGAGSGMVCHSLKGGIGSSSRVIVVDGKEYTVGVLVNSNFGSSKDLVFNKTFIGDKIKLNDRSKDQGSITIVVGTDLPLNNLQLKRVAKRAIIGVTNTGSIASNGSGEMILAFTTANLVPHYGKDKVLDIKSIHNDNIDLVFRAVIEATEEAVLNSLLENKTINGYQKKVYALEEFKEAYEDLLIKEGKDV